jgi:phage shock protein PspC (stress-responsive transcriptional regulator)
MRKVTTINLNNNACQVDEEGYELLRQYLDDAARALANNPDREEILSDIEQSIADRCRVALGLHKSVVSTEEMRRILMEMGPVIGGGRDAPPRADANATDGSAADSGTAGYASQSGRMARLYRILDGARWTFTGVCNGLAAYASVDVTWVRTAFVVLAVFTGGFALLAYGVLVFVLPVARTPEELAAAHGHPFSAQELVDRVKQKHEDLRASRSARREQRRAHRRGHHREQHFRAADPAVASHSPGPAARVAGGVMLPVFTVLSAGWFAVMLVAAFLAWQLWNQPALHWPPASMHLAQLPHWLPLVAVVAVYALFALPIGAGRRAAAYYANGGSHRGWADAWSGLLWFALVALVLVAAWNALPQLQALLHDVLDSPPPAMHLAWR